MIRIVVEPLLLYLFVTICCCMDCVVIAIVGNPPGCPVIYPRYTVLPCTLTLFIVVVLHTCYWLFIWLLPVGWLVTIRFWPVLPYAPLAFQAGWTQLYIVYGRFPDHLPVDLLLSQLIPVVPLPDGQL